jgi:hypothetical protein
MNALYGFVERVSLGWVIGLAFVLHLLLYLSLRTDHWLFATLAATVFYGAAFAFLKTFVRRRKRGVL